MCQNSPLGGSLPDYLFLLLLFLSHKLSFSPLLSLPGRHCSSALSLSDWPPDQLGYSALCVSLTRLGVAAGGGPWNRAHTCSSQPGKWNPGSSAQRGSRLKEAQTLSTGQCRPTSGRREGLETELRDQLPGSLSSKPRGVYPRTQWDSSRPPIHFKQRASQINGQKLEKCRKTNTDLNMHVIHTGWNAGFLGHRWRVHGRAKAGNPEE